MKPKYHITLGPKRTTVTIDDVLSDLLALKLSQQPGTAAAHSAVRAWLQATFLAKSNDPGRVRTSQWLAGEVALAVADPVLTRKWYKHLDT